MFHVRPASTSDAEPLSLLWRDAADTLSRLDPRVRLAPDAVTRWQTAFVRDLARTDQHTVVSVRDNALVAAMTGHLVPNAPGFLPEQLGLISELIVDSHGRGGGIGTDLYEALGGWFAAQGVTVIEARVPAHNPIAQAFWRALGAADISQNLRLKVKPAHE